nr:PREDICTED: uncharacterized protein LOC109038574 [Bemisia tabaci]
MPVSRSRGLVRRGRALHSRYMNRTCNVPLDKFNLESSVTKRCNPFKQVKAMSGQKSSSKEASFRGVLKELNSLVDNSDLVEEIESPTPVKSSSPTQNENLAEKSSSPTQKENLADPFKCFMVNPQEKSNNKEIKSISAESSPDVSLAIPLDNNLGSSSLKGRCSASGTYGVQAHTLQ